jgi:hypothetical protein
MYVGVYEDVRLPYYYSPFWQPTITSNTHLCTRALIIWPTRMLTRHMSSTKPSDADEEKQAVEDVEVYLRGPSHAIRSIAYAPDHDLILGAGFDYDVSISALQYDAFIC